MYSCKSTSFTILCDAVIIPYYDSCDIKNTISADIVFFNLFYVE